MIFCTLQEPDFKGYWSRGKELLKQLVYNKTIEYDPVQKLEKMLNKSKLETYLQLRMQTSLGYALCYIVKKV